MCRGNRNSRRPRTPRRTSWFTWSTRYARVSLLTSRGRQHYKTEPNLIGATIRTNWLSVCPWNTLSLLVKPKDIFSERIIKKVQTFSPLHLSNMNKLRLRHCQTSIPAEERNPPKAWDESQHLDVQYSHESADRQTQCSKHDSLRIYSSAFIMKERKKSLIFKVSSQKDILVKCTGGKNNNWSQNGAKRNEKYL